MSCQISLTAIIPDISAIRRCLFPTDDSRGSEGWLQQCKVSVSPTGDIIAIAKDRRVVILTAKWDSVASIDQFHITFSGTVHENDNIKAIVVLPLVGQTKTSHVVPDWTCVSMGFESGFVRFYTEKCELLLEEQLHNEIITSIKPRSQHSPRPDMSADLHPEHIYVQYQTCVCVLTGTQLFATLRDCRSELARVQAKGFLVEPIQSNLTLKKWGFQDQTIVNDIAVVGSNLTETFDHLLAASSSGGFEAKCSSSVPFNNLVLAAGSRPFIGYQYAFEGSQQLVFSDVAKVVATKLKSALPGWLTGTKAPLEKQVTVAMQPPESMGCRFGLCDVSRNAISIILSPDHRFAAVSDALGRVLLIDAFRGITLRIFKGYREAQCSFIQVPDERHSKHRLGNKVALFLIIYSPKKGTIDIFTVQQGQKVATFTASKNSLLVYNNYALMGFPSASKSRYGCHFDTVLIDNDGQIKEILVPFHFALSEKNNKRARDIHLYKKMKQVIKSEEESDSSRILEFCEELKTTEIKLQTIEMLLTDKNLSGSLILNCLQCFLKDCDSEKLKLLCENASLVINLFIFAKNSGEKADTTNELQLSDKQLSTLEKLLDLNTVNKPSPKVAFKDGNQFPPSEFLSAFNLNQEGTIELQTKLEDSVLMKTSQHLFQKYVQGYQLGDLENQIKKTPIPIRDFFYLLMNFWVRRQFDSSRDLVGEMNNMYRIIKVLVNCANPEEIHCDYSSTAKIWEDVREILENSARPFPAFTAAILCQLISENVDSSISPDIEVYSQERIHWNLLIGKLEDVSLLNIILNERVIAQQATLPKLKHDDLEVSLKYILQKGKGSVSELVSRWLTQSGINPEIIVINDILIRKRTEVPKERPLDDSDEEPEQDVMPQKVEEVQNEPIVQRLNLIKAQFPYSLEAGLIVANMCWEYALAWQKDVQNLGNLEACIKCLGEIPNPQFRSGLSYLLWNTHLKVIFESTAKLINKVGKLPKERLCKQDTSLSDYQIALFLGYCTEFFQLYVNCYHCNENPKPILKYEQLWENGPQPLVELALQQHPINSDLLQLHFQLSLCLQMMTTFSVKHTKPMQTLFESYMLSLFFVDLQTSSRINWDYADSRVQTSRSLFLTKIITASLETVTVVDNGFFAGDHLKWMEKCIEIGRVWNLDLDVLRRHELIQVYRSGFDRFGDQLYNSIRDRETLGLELLAVAGKRLSQFLATSPNIVENTVALTTTVTKYIEELNGDWCTPSSLEGIENLANRSLACIAENSYERRVAELLLDGCQSLLKIHSAE